MRVVLAQKDLDKALRFYTRTCGFQVEGPGGGEPGRGAWLLRRGAARVRLVDEAGLVRTSPMGRRLGKSPGAGVAIEVALDPAEPAKELFTSFEQAGADIVEPLGDWQPGERSFTVADPANYLIRFYQTR
jgi:catechol 2,3-dioxygenase-like lactoylglutathione lyase family enzyme